MKKLALILTLVLIPALSLAQTSGKISGTVSSDGQPLVGANVLIEGTSYGAATDENGQYYILDVPVGVYEIEAQYIGYKTLTVNNIHVNANLTTDLVFPMELAAVEGETVTVTAERPLIQRNATNTTAILDEELLQALPVRTIGGIVSLQAGAVGTNVRGGRASDNAYYIDGVLMRDRWNGGNFENSLSQQSMSEVSFQAGGMSSEYGGATGGVVTVVTAAGGRKFNANAEYVSDLGDTSPGKDRGAMYNYGNKLFNFSVGGPLTSNIRWFGLVEQQTETDRDPRNATAPFMDREIFTRSEWLASSLSEDYTWEEDDYAPGYVFFDEIVRDNQTVTADLIAGVEDLDTTYVLGSNYRSLYGPKRTGESKRMTYQGNLDMDFRPFRIKVGMGGYNSEDEPYSHRDHLMNWDGIGYNHEDNNRYMYANATWSISSKSYLKAILSQSAFEHFAFNSSGQAGDEDDASSSGFEDFGVRSTTFGDDTYYLDRHGRNADASKALVYYYAYGDRYDDYTQRFQKSNGLRLDYLNQLGFHEVKAGMERYSTEYKWYRIGDPYEIAERTARLDADFDGALTALEVGDQNSDGVNDADDLEYWRSLMYRNAYVDALGYDIYGKASSKYNFDSFATEPGNSVETRFYIQDKIELKDVVVQLGFSYETWEPNTYAPDSDGDGKGDAEGFRNIHMSGGRIDRSGTKDGSYKWEKVEKHSALMPRLGFSFPVTDRTAFHANYGVYMQAPALQYVYLTDAGLAANMTQGNFTQSENPALKPERTTAYEVGVSQVIGQVAALDITGYYKESRDYLLEKNHVPLGDDLPLLDGSETSWSQFMNGDYGVTQGFSASLRMRRIKGVLAQVNYTYMNARGTGSAADDNSIISWIGGSYPVTVNRLAFDQKHTGAAIIDYRNPLGFGVNAVYTFGSGQAYTPTTVESVIFGRGWDEPVAAINSGDKPWVTNLDLRADYNLKFGGASVNLYVTVVNALNAVNVEDVYQSTGQAGTDAFLDTAEGKVWVASQEAEYPATAGLAGDLYLSRTAVPTRWHAPRIVRFGLQVNI